MIWDLASASTYCLLWERGYSDLTAIAGYAILADSGVAGKRHGSQGMSGIGTGVSPHPSYTPTKYLTTMRHDMGPCFSLNILCVVGDRVLRSGGCFLACSSRQKLGD